MVMHSDDEPVAAIGEASGLRNATSRRSFSETLGEVVPDRTPARIWWARPSLVGA
jgi:hypothetical protein